MHYTIFILLCIIAITISIFALKWAIKDATRLSQKEIDSLGVGDRITIRTPAKDYITGRIVLINRSTGWGILNAGLRGRKYFHISHIRSLA